MKRSNVDEEFIMGLIASGVPRPKPETPPPKSDDEQLPQEETAEPPPPATKERRSKATTAKCEEYMNRFFSGEGIHNRKPLYIGAEIYDIIYDEVFAIKGRKASVGAFAESVFREHFKEHEEVITQIKKSKK